jgi:uroporphyrinogen-III synthase
MPSGSSSTARPVLVTRPAGRGDALVSLLAQQGLTVEHHPLIRIVLDQGPELTAARERLADGAYTHLVITSRTAVEALSPLVVPTSTQVVAVGEGSAAALAAAGAPAQLIASGSGAALVDAMPPATAKTAVLFPASAAAAPTVPDGLVGQGYRVDQVTAYHPEPLPLPKAPARALAGGDFSAIVLTSAMIARCAVGIGIHPSTAIITIGGPTSEAVRAAGLPVAAEAEQPAAASLADAVARALAAHLP